VTNSADNGVVHSADDTALNPDETCHNESSCKMNESEQTCICYDRELDRLCKYGF